MADPTPLLDVARWYGTICSPSFFAQLRSQEQGVRRNGIYDPRVVVWLMIWQRLQAARSAAAAVEQLALGPMDHLLSDCKRVRERRISTHTGGYCQARQKLPTRMAHRVYQRTMEEFAEELRQARPAGPPVCIWDGSTLQLQHQPELLRAYPPARNQKGEGHWGVLQLLVVHDAYSGLVLETAWGPMYGAQAVSEQKLAERLLDRLPGGAILIGDRNLGIFATVYAAQQRQHAVVVRLNRKLARRLGGPHGPPEQTVLWRPSARDRQKHPELPEEASVGGRLLVVAAPGTRDGVLYLFTTWDGSAAEVVELYKLRWNIETDLRSLKRTVALDRLQSKSPEMMEKELLLGLAAYNLVRTVMLLAARQAGVTPREISFARVLGLVQACLPYLADGQPREDQDRRFNHLVHLAASCKLPKRKRRRSYPRAVWGRGYRFPSRNSMPAHETKTK